MDQSSLDEELEAIMAIYIDELSVNERPDGTKDVQITLHPATAENVDQQYVCITLILKVSQKYPNEVPEILIKNPRGLSDEELYTIKKDLLKKAEETQGHEMLYQLIELAKEYLTAGNSPSCECSICLYNFLEADVFLKTECYHYFHSYCLASYAEQPNDTPGSTKNILCPVCRAEISYQVPKSKDQFPPPIEEMNDSCNLNNSLLREQQKILSEIYEKQKANGGIIDVEAEKTKFLLNISAPPQGNEIEVPPARFSTTEPEDQLTNGDTRDVARNIRDTRDVVGNIAREATTDAAKNAAKETIEKSNIQPQCFKKQFRDNKKYKPSRSRQNNSIDTTQNSAISELSKSSKDSFVGKPHEFSSRSFKANSHRTKYKAFTKPNTVDSQKTKSSMETFSAKQQDSFNLRSDKSSGQDNSRPTKGHTNSKQNPVDPQNSNSLENPFSANRKDYLNSKSERKVNSRPTKSHTNFKQNPVDSQNSKSLENPFSANRKDYLNSKSERSAKYYPKADKSQSYRQSAFRTRRPPARRFDEHSSFSDAKSNTNKRTHSGVSNDISASTKGSSMEVSSLTASVSELSVAPGVKPPPGFLPKFKNNPVQPPPGYASR